MAESKYLEFKFVEAKPKTQVWNVLSKSDGSVLGTVKWYAPWRQYCFFPQGETIKEIRQKVGEMILGKPAIFAEDTEYEKGYSKGYYDAKEQIEAILAAQAETVFSAGCIGDIINFMNDLKKAK